MDDDEIKEIIQKSLENYKIKIQKTDGVIGLKLSIVKRSDD